MAKKWLMLLSFFIVVNIMAATHQAPVDVQDPWIRATVAGQQGTGGFMKLTAREDLTLIRVTSPVAGVAQIHEMHMNKDNVMEMRPMNGLALAKGKTVELKSGGYHLMLEDLKRTLNKNTTVPLKLLFRDAKGQESTIDLVVPVSLSAAHDH